MTHGKAMPDMRCQFPFSLHPSALSILHSIVDEINVPTMPNDPQCPHLDLVQPVAPASTVCEECVRLGDEWVHLRACLSCGRVGCCDQSKNRHATKHYLATSHPLIRSLEPGENWLWCYVDEVGFDLD